MIQALLFSLLLVPVRSIAPALAEEQEPLSMRESQAVTDAVMKLSGDIAKRVRDERSPGFTIAVVDRQGVVWKYFYGTRTQGGMDPLLSTTLFGVQSLSKPVTALGVMIAVQQGLLDLDTPIAKYLPKFTVHSRFEEHPEQKITLRHLLAHRSGLTHEAPVGNTYESDNPTFEAHIKSISDTWLRYPVGHKYAYSNLGIDLAGYVLETVAKKPFAQWMSEEVLQPLGMKTATFDWKTIAATEDRARGQAAGHPKIPLEFAMIPSSGLYASLDDMMAFVQFHLNRGRVGDKQVLKESLLDEMGKIPFGLEQTKGQTLGAERRYWNGTLAFVQSGAGYGFQSHVRWYPFLGVGLVMLSNSMDHQLLVTLPDAILEQLINAAGGVKVSVPEEKKLEPVSVDPAVAKKWVGSYRDETMRIEVEPKDKGLTFRFRKSDPFDFRFTSNDEGFVEMNGERQRFRFVAWPDGTPSYVMRVSDGQSCDLMERDDDTKGPDKEEWKKYAGTYRHLREGQPAGDWRVHVKNGYLYIEVAKLTEHPTEKGLFFASNGEALDFRKDPPTWRSVPLQRLP